MTEESLRELIEEAGSRSAAIEAFEQWAEDNHDTDDRDRENYRYEDEEPDDWESEERTNNARAVIGRYLDEHPGLLGVEVTEPQPE